MIKAHRARAKTSSMTKFLGVAGCDIHPAPPTRSRLEAVTRRMRVKVNGRSYRTIWLNSDGRTVDVIDQRWLPHEFRIETLRSLSDAATAIRDMWVRGAPLIGVTAAYGVALAMSEDTSDAALDAAWERLHATRPTAINLRWALDAVRQRLRRLAPAARAAAAYAEAQRIGDEDVAINRAIGRNGLEIVHRLAAQKKRDEPVNILTHCNAGWLATVDFGTATAPIYLALEEGLAVHVYVDETRPRNQGAHLTAWELANHGAPHTLIVDNAGGHLMQHGLVDMVIVGSDRTTANGDVCNKIGTYLKALAAHDNNVPFYVALPSPTIDWTVRDGVREIPIEERGADEVDYVQGRSDDGAIRRVRISPDGGRAANPAFDVTPARLVTGLITERGVAEASPQGLSTLFPERSVRAVG
jgi:methylthioribose-1-phosphate isomerase